MSFYPSDFYDARLPQYADVNAFVLGAADHYDGGYEVAVPSPTTSSSETLVDSNEYAGAEYAAYYNSTPVLPLQFAQTLQNVPTAYPSPSPPAEKVDRPERKSFHDRASRVLISTKAYAEKPNKEAFIVMLRASTINNPRSRPKLFLSPGLKSALAHVDFLQIFRTVGLIHRERNRSWDAEVMDPERGNRLLAEVDKLKRDLQEAIQYGEQLDLTLVEHGIGGSFGA
ncbi:hypothetical protein EIP91_005160 [Steccherinum ochraceum]|uniref:Uncharacterized protein n=1 Tax=Steccherinum ochraceum TaxID=92696 RepID=A0A4R0RAI3_9APHY|nr:hypothetical protein EIP91_005160 [Steccherinum ochraceum]